jgi:Secretion system C-terminal sorting domain
MLKMLITGTKKILMKIEQTKIGYMFFLAAILLINNSQAQGTNSNDTTKALPVVPFSMTVVFVEYEIVTKAQGNHINWSTILESNLGAYEIQRSAANQTFETIGTIQAKGTASVTVDYSFIDTRPNAGKNIYRIKMIDTRNGVQYSSIKMVTNELMTARISSSKAYPNPARPGMAITLDVNEPGQYTVRMHNLSGKMIYADQAIAGHQSSLSIRVPSNLSAGMYIMDVTDQETLVHFQQKIIIQ